MELGLSGDLPYEVHAYGQRTARLLGIQNWSLGALGLNHPSAERAHYLTTLSNLLDTLAIKRAYAPETKTASAVIDHDAAQYATEVACDAPLAAIYRRFGFPADGGFIEPEEAIIISPAGCPIIVAHARGHMAVAHAGRDSLIERAMLQGVPERKHFSVVDAIIASFQRKGVPPREVHLHMMLALSPEQFFHPFAHPTHGTYNRALAAYLHFYLPESDSASMLSFDGIKLNLESVFTAQAKRAGVTQAWVSHPLVNFPDLVQSAASPKRNLVVIKRLQ